MLDWEEHAFVGLRALYRRMFACRAERARLAVRATLAERRAALLLLAQMIAGRPLSLFESDAPRLCAEDRIFLPREWSAAATVEGNVALYTLKTVIAALALRQRGALSPWELAGACSDELPHLAELISVASAALPPERSLWELLGSPLPEKASAARDGAPLSTKPDTTPAEPATEIAGRGQAEVEVLAAEVLDHPGAEMPEHVFEKVETIEEHTGPPRKTDDDDALSEHEEALRELDMRRLLRTPERPRSIYRADVILDGFSVEIGDDAETGGIPYPEWDYRRRAYRPAWCRVIESRASRADAAWTQRATAKHRATIQRMRRQFSALRSDLERLRRQPAGPELDFDAAVHAEVLRRTGGAPGELLYTDVRRDLHDLAALVLLDESYSTDAYLDGARVLDVIAETIFCVGEVLGDTIEKFAVASFSSNTRRSCRFTRVKDFAEPWRTARDRLGALAACGYTRIGPALRHAQERLAIEPARRKVILLITDGRPCDYDRYEGLHGIRDVKKAIDTGRAHGIQTHAFAIEKHAAEFFPAMFAHHGYDIVATPARLTETMCRLFARLLRG
jgi:nitric oxide reductase NorD protein